MACIESWDKWSQWTVQWMLTILTLFCFTNFLLSPPWTDMNNFNPSITTSQSHGWMEQRVSFQLQQCHLRPVQWMLAILCPRWRVLFGFGRECRTRKEMAKIGGSSPYKKQPEGASQSLKSGEEMQQASGNRNRTSWPLWNGQQEEIERKKG